MFSPRVIQLLSSSNLLMQGISRIDITSLLVLLASNLPRATYGEAYSDTDGTYARLPFEMLPFMFPGVDLTQEDPETITELIDKVYRPYVSVKADGALQMAWNGDGRSFLVDASVYRSGIKLRGARFISDDEVAVLALDAQRNKGVVQAAVRASEMQKLIGQRRPELLPAVYRRGLQTAQDVTRLMAPGATVQLPAGALPAPADDEPPAAAGVPASPTPPADPSGPAGAAVDPTT